MLTALVLALVLAPAADVAVITPDQAKDHVGQDVVVQGQVTQVGASERSHTVFLNFGGRYPNHTFTAVIFSKNLQSFPDARSWEGKTITVRGQLHQGKPEIVLERQEQVTVSSATPSEASPGSDGSRPGDSPSAHLSIGGLYFDPQGADFSAWINQFKKEVYSNWIIPQSGIDARGHVNVTFTVKKDGSMLALKLLKSSVTPVLNSAALNALADSWFRQLPKGYGPSSVTMQVSFFYNEAPPGSQTTKPD
jgi:TonB family protein